MTLILIPPPFLLYRPHFPLSAFLQEHHLPAGAGTRLLGSVFTRPGAFPGAKQAPCNICSHNAFQKHGQEELDPTVFFFFSVSV